jgi:thioredoxin-like negative regulator of GroEL
VSDNKDSKNLNIGKVNVDENGDTAMKYGIRGIPTLLFIKDLVNLFTSTYQNTQL